MTEPNQEIPETANSDQDLMSPSAEPNAKLDENSDGETETAAGEAEPTEQGQQAAEPAEADGSAEEPEGEQAAAENKSDQPASPKKKRKKKKKEAPAPPPEPSYKHEYTRRMGPGGDNGFQLSPEGLLRHFLGCRICCYFLTGVQVLYGREVVDRMVHEFDGKWLEVPLTNETRSLMLKTYGLRLDVSDHYIDHACEVCCRRFVIDWPEPEQKVEDESAEAEAAASDQELERIETAEEAMPTRRTIEEQVVEWNAGEMPLLLVEFKHRR